MLLCMLGACTLDGPAVPTPDRPALDTVLDSEVADSGSAPDTGCVDSDPEGTVRSLRVRTEESPSWVAWAELEVVGVDGPLTALATLDGSSPGGLEALRDGDPATNWNAGDFAPQWVRLDFDLPVTLSRVLLTVAQSPSGATEHVLETAGPCDDRSRVPVTPSSWTWCSRRPARPVGTASSGSTPWMCRSSDLAWRSGGPWMGSRRPPCSRTARWGSTAR